MEPGAHHDMTSGWMEDGGWVPFFRYLILLTYAHSMVQLVAACRKPAYTYKISLVKGSEFKHYETYYEPYPQERTGTCTS